MNNKYLIYGAMGLAGGWSSEQPLKQAEIDDGINVLESVIDSGIEPKTFRLYIQSYRF